MERFDFQRILSLVDTIHDYKASTRGNLTDAKVFKETFLAELKDTYNIEIPNKGVSGKSRMQIIYENIANISGDVNIDLNNVKSIVMSEDDFELPYYIEDFIAENPIVSKQGSIDILTLIEKPPKNMPYNPNRLLETFTLMMIHNGFRKSLGLSINQHYINEENNCSKYTKFTSNSTTIDFCKKIYAKAYPSDNLYKSVAKLEENILNIAMKYADQQGYVSNNIIEWKDITTIQSSKYAKICIGRKKPLEGIYKSDTPTNDFLELVQKFFENREIIFAYDSNGLENEWMKGNRYKGIFVDYDSMNQDVKSFSKKGGMPLVYEENYDKEFQEYKLTKTKNELILFDELKCTLDNDKFLLYFRILNKEKKIDLETRSKGLPLFLKLFDEITKRTLGYKNIAASKFIKEQLADGLKKLCLEDFKKMYKITLVELDEQEEQYIKLKKEDFIKALFDIKRSMDYLYVKACLTANMREKQKSGDYPQEKKFVFVSADKSAIAYSLMLNNPCILTTTKEGNKYIEIFNPNEVFYNTDEIQNPNNSKSKLNVENTLNGKNAQISFKSSIQSLKQGPSSSDLIELLDKLKFIPPNEITLGQGKTKYNMDDCKDWKLNVGHLSRYQSIMKKICDDYQKSKTKVGGFGNNVVNNVNSNSNNANARTEVVDQEIPLDNIHAFAEFGSPFYMFLQFYSQLSPTLDFFWFTTFKTYFFVMFGDDMMLYQERKPQLSPSPYIGRQHSLATNNAKPNNVYNTRRVISNPGNNTFKQVRKK